MTSITSPRASSVRRIDGSVQHKIPVFILQEHHSDDNRTVLVASMFNHSMFTVHVVGFPPSSTVDKSAAEIEHQQFLETLKFAKDQHNSLHCIIIRDSSVTHATPETIAEIINMIIQLGDYDIFYLCKWLDRCDLYQNKHTLIGRSTSVVQTHAPNGLQAVMISADGADRLLGRRAMRESQDMAHFDIKNGELAHQIRDRITRRDLLAKTTDSNLVNYDRTIDPSQAFKSQECEITQIFNPATPVAHQVPRFDEDELDLSGVPDLVEQTKDSLQEIKDKRRHNQSRTSGWVIFLACLIVIIIIVLVVVLVMRKRGTYPVAKMDVDDF